MTSESHDEAVTYWETMYRGRPTPTALRPSPVLVEFVGATEIAPGTALDLGCSRGDDALWLAGRGWSVVGVDIAETALAVGRERARAAGLAIDFQQHDLARSLPEGTFDLVTAQYLQTPIAFPRAAVLARAAAAVAPGGLLLVVEHASHRPWSTHGDPNAVFPPAEELVGAMAIDPAAWTISLLARREREATGPNGEKATVADNIAALRRK